MSTVYSFSLSVAFIRATMVELNYTQLLGLCCIFSLVFSIFFFNKYSAIIGFSAAAITAIIVLVLARSRPVIVDNINAYLNTIRELIPVLENQIVMATQHEKAFVLGATFIFSLFAAFNIGAFFNVMLPGIIGVVVFITPSVLGFQKSAFALFVFLVCFTVLLIKRLNLFVVKKPNAAFGMLAIPLSAILLITAVLLPKPEVDAAAAATEQVVKTATDAVQRVASGVTQRQQIELSRNGKDLGGPINMSDDAVMQVRSERPVYLRGAVYDTYNGKSWSTSLNESESLEQDESNFYNIVPDETTAEGFDYLANFLGNGVSELEIYMMENRTDIIYTPLTSIAFYSDQDLKLKQNYHRILSPNRTLKEETNYLQTYIPMDLKNEYLKEQLRESSSNITETEELQKCLELPDLPSRLVSLTYEITGSATNNYDTIKALEEFLAAFPYTLTPGVFTGEDFVDHFIFEEQQGYCVYYATALAVMGRIEGIPTRYVEGYVMPSERNEDGNFTVTGKQAHAWTEVYFENFGWVAFEPTSPYYANTYETELPNHEALVPEPGNEEILQPGQEIAEQQEAEPEREQEILEPEKPSYTALKIVLIILLIIAIIAFVIWRRIQRNREFFEKLEKKQNRQAVEIYYSLILKNKKILGNEIEKGETPKDFSKRISEVATKVEVGDFDELTEIFLKAAYSDADIDDQQRDFCKNYYLQILEKTKEFYKFQTLYFINKEILMRI